MATYLYRLGRLAARRAWAVVAIWALLLAGLVGGATQLMKPFTSEMTIPGTEFQTVLDDLKTELPEAAGGIGTVVFRTDSGRPFTADQKKAVASAVDAWGDLDGIEEARDPFDVQKQLDDAATQVADGEKELEDGAQKIKDNEKKLADGRQQVADGEKKLADGQQKIKDNEARLADSAEKIEASEKKLATSEKRLADGRAQLERGRAELRAGEAQYAQGLQQYQGAQAQLAQLRARLGAQAPQVQQLRAQLAASKQQLDASRARLDAGQVELTRNEAAIRAGEQQLAAGKQQLAEGRAQLEAGQQQLAAGTKELADSRAQLEQARDDITTGEKKLADAKKELAEGRVDLARGTRQVALTDGLRFVSDTGNVALAQVIFDKPINEVEQTTRDAIVTAPAAAALAGAGVTVDYSKDITQNISSLMGPGEIVGLAIAALVLLVMLGSVLAAGLPLLTALVGVGVGLLAALTMTHWVEMTDVTPALALMLGLAVGIDYALFIVNRHREQLVRGVPLEESIGRATGTAGSAVLFAGMTVLVALAALTLTGIPFLGTMGLVAAGTVLVSVLVSLTLTPALLRLIGQRILSRRSRRALRAQLDREEHERTEQSLHHDDDHAGRGKGWGGLVTRHPYLTLLASTLLLAGLALPATQLRLGLPDGSFEPHDSTAYRTYQAIDESFGPGANGPVIAVAKVDADRAKGLSDDEVTDLSLSVAEQMRDTKNVEYVVPIGHSDDKQTLAFQLVPATGPSEEKTVDLVNDLRADSKAVVADNGLDSMGFTGQTVANIDISRALGDALPLYLGVVVGISLLLLLLVFRSLVVPFIATAGFLLSVAAAFGAVVAVYQWGHLGSLLGVEQAGPVLSFLPTLVIGVLFGLAMDYQMFLVTGMREAWAHGQDARTAVRSGFSHGARVVTAAALIMAAVFAGFIHAQLTMIRPIGFALAIGVLLDAFIVRMTATPAIMHLLGEKAWYLPRWLDRILPDLDVEGTRLVAERERREALAAAPTEQAPAHDTGATRA